MSGYAVFVYKGELIVAHGADAANQLAARLTSAITSGEAVGAVVRKAGSGVVPMVETYNEATFLRDVGETRSRCDWAGAWFLRRDER